MALGGGTFTATNKILPGSYINFVSNGTGAVESGERGVVACPLMLDWGPDGVFELSGDIAAASLKTFGYEYTDPALAPVRELFKHATKVYAYRLNGGGVKAANNLGEAKYTGERGNAISIAVAATVDSEGSFDVSTLLDSIVRDTQTVTKPSELKDNDYVVFKKDDSTTLEATAAVPLSGGANAESATGGGHSAFLNAVEAYDFNVLACPSADASIIATYIAFTKRMRDKMGVKFQTVIADAETNADYEGVIDVVNKVTDDGANGYELVYWTAGAQAACPLNRALTNTTYDGEYEINTAYTQAQLETFITGGKFVFHRVGDDVRVLTDINSLTTFTTEKDKAFGKNKTVRVIDAIGNDIAAMFNDNYLGLVPNDASGRNSFAADIIKHHTALQNSGVIEGFSGDDVTVTMGEENTQVIVTDAVTVTGMMEQLYMTVVVG